MTIRVNFVLQEIDIFVYVALPSSTPGSRLLYIIYIMYLFFMHALAHYIAHINKVNLYH